MAEQNLPNGARVELKSGGPEMTVMGYDVFDFGGDTKKYQCRWWDEKKQEFKEDYFIEESIQRVD